MGWLAVRGKALNVLGVTGEKVLGAYAEVAEVYRAVDFEAIEEARTELNKKLKALGAQQIGDLPDVFEQLGSPGETMKWLTQDVGDIAAGDEKERERAYPLLGWTPKKEVSVSKAKVALSFGVKASLTLSVAEGEDDTPPNLTIALSGGLDGKVDISATSLPEVINKVSFAFEAKAERSITYVAEAASKEISAAAGFKTVFGAIKESPRDLDATFALLDGGIIEHIELKTLNSRKLNAGLGVSVPLTTGAPIKVGKLTFSVDIEQVASDTLTTQILEKNGKLRLSATRDRTDKSSRNLAFGLKATIGSGEIFKAAGDALTKLQGVSKKVIAELGKLADLDELLKEEVKTALDELFPDAAPGDAITKSLFDKDAKDGLLADYLLKHLKKPAALWLDEAQDDVRAAALDGLGDAGWSDIRIGEKSLRSAAETALDKVLGKVREHVDAELDKIVENALEKKLDKAQDALGDIGASIDETLRIDKIEEAAGKLKKALETMLKRVDRVKKALETAAENTLALNYTSLTKADDTLKEEFVLDFTPKTGAAKAAFADAVLAPRSFVSAFMDEADSTKIDGVDLVGFTSVARRRRSVQTSLKLNLFGFDVVDLSKILSSDTTIYQVGGEVRVAGRAEAKRISKRLSKETQSVTAAYLYRDPTPIEDGDGSAYDAILDQLLADSGDGFETPLAITIVHNDKDSLRPSELTKLLENFEEGEIAKPVRNALVAQAADAREDQSGKLKAELTFALKLNNNQIDALGELDDAHLRETIVEEMTEILVDSDIWDEVEAALSWLERKDIVETDLEDTADFFKDLVKVASINQLEDLESIAFQRAARQKVKIGIFWLKRARRLADAFAGTIGGARAIRENLAAAQLLKKPSERAAAAKIRADLIDEMKEKLAIFARAKDESLSYAPLSLIRAVRELSPQGGAAIPDLVVSFKDLETEETKLFSNAIDG